MQAGMALSLVRQGGSVEYIVGYVADEELGVIVVMFSVCVNKKSRGLIELFLCRHFTGENLRNRSNQLIFGLLHISRQTYYRWNFCYDMMFTSISVSHFCTQAIFCRLS